MQKIYIFQSGTGTHLSLSSSIHRPFGLFEGHEAEVPRVTLPPDDDVEVTLPFQVSVSGAILRALRTAALKLKAPIVKDVDSVPRPAARFSISR